MNIGFTGTQIGMTGLQKMKFTNVLKDFKSMHYFRLPFKEPLQFLHGDCVGADVEAATIAKELGFYVIAFPPVIETKRAFHKSDKIMESKPYLERNLDIVLQSHVMIATPKTGNEELRSGTWSTVRVSKLHGKELYLIRPSGSIFHRPKPVKSVE